MPQAAIPIAASVAGSAVGSLLSKGGGGGGSSGGSSTVQQQQLDPDIKARLLSLIDRAQGVADAPYVPYGGARVAGFAPDQESGFQQVRDYATAGIGPNRYAQGVTAQETEFDPLQGPTSLPEIDLAEYLNPFTDMVAGRVEDELRRYGAQSDREADSKAALTGAFGGDRAGIVKTEMARNREATLGNTLSSLYKGGYDSATSLATADLNRRLQAGISGAGIRLGAAQQLAGLGAQEQQLGLQGAAALENVGAQQRGLLQRNLDTAYGDFQEQREYPFRTTNFLAGITHGSPVNREGTSTTTGPEPSMLGQIAGLGAAGVGLAGVTGGFGANGWLSNLFSNSGGGGGASPVMTSTGQPFSNGSDYGYFARGGRVGPRPYADGGFVDDGGDGLEEPFDYTDDFEDQLSATFGEDGEVDAYYGYQNLKKPDNMDAVGPEIGGIGNEALPGGAGDDRLTAGIAGAPQVAPAAPRQAGIADQAQVQQTLRKGVGQPEAKGEIPSWALPLTVAGFAMMASRNPNAAGAVGEGGIAALKTYSDTKRAEALVEKERQRLMLGLEALDEKRRHNREVEKPKPYTLSPGQVVKEPGTGRTLAEGGPKVPEGYTVGPDGQLVLDQSYLEGKGKLARAQRETPQEAAAKAGAVAAAGAAHDKELVKVINPDGRTVWMSRAKAAGMPAAEGADKESDLKIAELMRQGLSREDAAAIGYGFKSITTDPVNGQMFLVDKRNATRTPIQTPGSPERPDLPKETQKRLEDDAIRIERVLPLVRDLKKNLSEVGVTGVAKDLVGRTVGQVIPGAVSEQNVQQRADLRRARQALIDSGRMSNQEGQRLLEQWPSDGVFESPTRARLVLDQIDKHLTEQHSDTTKRLGRGPRVAAPANKSGKLKYNPATGEVE